MRNPVLRIRDVLSRISTRSGSKHFFIPDPESYMKSGTQTYVFLASYAFRSKILILVVVKKIRDPDKNSSRTPGVKKHRILDPEHWRNL
jgi:hypothetical protein